jgi:hypothetical protein
VRNERLLAADRMTQQDAVREATARQLIDDPDRITYRYRPNLGDEL